MAEEGKNGNEAATGGPPAARGVKAQQEQSEVTLTLKVRMSGSSQDILLDYPCRNLNATSLSEIVNFVRNLFQVGDSAAVRVLTSASQTALDQTVPLNTILSKLRAGDQLIVQIDSLEEGEDGEGKVRHYRDNITLYTKPAGEMKHEFNSSYRDIVRVPNTDYILLREEVLETLTEKVERPLMLASVCLFLGVTLGSIVSILLALADDSLTALTRERLRGALFVAAIASLFLFVLGYFIKAESNKAVRPVTNMLARKGKKR
jgi:hypothetical protein